MNFQATFTRYNGKTAQRQISGLWLFTADNFADAYNRARLYMDGMRDAGAGDWTYEIVGIETTAFSGERVANHGPTIWQGPEHFTQAKATA